MLHVIFSMNDRLLQTYRLQKIYYGAGKAAVMAMTTTDTVVSDIMWSVTSLRCPIS